MPTLYSRLFKYQSSDFRSKKENYLTEALCDLLIRWGPKQSEIFVSELLNLTSLNGPSKSMTWESQQTGTTSRPDLVGFVDGKPFIAIENKIDARFTARQLRAHGKWIAQESGGNAALVCLTARHTPPPDFLDGSIRKYGVPCKQRRICSWSHVQFWLSKHHRFEMASEFAEFLRDEGMDAIRHKDFGHLKGYLENEVDRKVKAAMDWAFSHAVRPVIGQKRKPEMKFMDGCVYSLFRFRRSPAKDIEIQWGFSPGTNDQCFDRDFGPAIVGFVGMWAPNGRLKAFTTEMRPWIRIWGGDFWVQTISAKQLLLKPDPADAFAFWLKPKIADADKRIKSL